MPQTKTVLITGGASGLGFEFAKLFANDKCDLVLVGQDKEKLYIAKNDLEKTFGVSIKIISKDLSKPTSSQEIFDELKKDETKIDILVNNAGFSKYGLFKDISIEEDTSEINVNVMALTNLTKLFLPSMLEINSGKILNIASTAAFAPGPMMSVYFATKAYVLSFSEALSEELEGTQVTATVLCPGPTTTGFAKRANIQNSHLYRKPMKAEMVALTGYKGLMINKKVVIPGFNNNLFVNLLRLAPRSVVPGVVKKIW